MAFCLHGVLQAFGPIGIQLRETLSESGQLLLNLSPYLHQMLWSASRLGG